MLHHLLGIADLKKEDLEFILSVANHIASNPSRYEDIAKGKILATLFFEPSTRTRLSFESAILRLGGSVIGFSDMSASATAKGETIEDTAKVVSCYSDIMAVRHPVAYSPHKMSEVATVPVVNAGDGANEHPTQTLTDLAAIYKKFGRLENLTIGLCGDLKYGRTVHSLIKMLSRYSGNRFILIAPPELQMPEDIIKDLDNDNIPYTMTTNLEESISELDILYMTRIQRERFDDFEQYNALKGIYVLDTDKMSHAKRDMIVLHPLPRVDEITVEVDNDPRAWYFKQAQMGVYARMALMILLLELHEKLSEEVMYVYTAEKRNLSGLSHGA